MSLQEALQKELTAAIKTTYLIFGKQTTEEDILGIVKQTVAEVFAVYPNEVGYSNKLRNE